MKEDTVPIKLPGGIIASKIPIYGGNFIFVNTEKKWNTVCSLLGKTEHLLKDAGAAPLGQCAEFYVDIRGKTNHFLVIAIFDHDMSTLVHECVHAGVLVLNYRGVDAGSSNGESLTYLVEWFFRNSYPHLGRKRKGTK